MNLINTLFLVHPRIKFKYNITNLYIANSTYTNSTMQTKNIKILKTISTQSMYRTTTKTFFPSLPKMNLMLFKW